MRMCIRVYMYMVTVPLVCSLHNACTCTGFNLLCDNKSCKIQYIDFISYFISYFEPLDLYDNR